METRPTGFRRIVPFLQAVFLEITGWTLVTNGDLSTGSHVIGIIAVVAGLVGLGVAVHVDRR